MIRRRVTQRSRQPEIGAQVNFDDPITRDLNGFYPLSYHTRNVSRGGLPDMSANNGAAVANYALNRYAGFLDGVDDDFRIAHNTLLNLGGTWSCWIKTDGLWGVDNATNGTTVRGTAIFLSKVTATGSVGSIHATVSENGVVSFQSKTGSTTTIWNATGPSNISLIDDRWHHVACTFGTASGSQQIVYVDGVAGTPVTSSGAMTTTTEPLRIGTSADTFWEQFKGHISNVAIWSRVLSRNEIVQLAGNPWQLFRPAANQTFYSLPAQGTAYSLALDAGSYTLTGRDVGTSFGRSLALDAGAYNLTGRIVGLTWSGETPVEITDRIVTLRSLTERWRM